MEFVEGHSLRSQIESEVGVGGFQRANIFRELYLGNLPPHTIWAFITAI